MQNNWRKAEIVLKEGKVVVLPTDTLYGIVGKAKSKKTVEKIYKIKERNENKPFIVLINSYKQLEMFGVKTTKEQAKILKKFWPGKVSIILPCEFKKWQYIHRGTKSIAFRMIGFKNKNLFNLINKVGSLVAPSANPEGLSPAKNITEAREYFGDEVDLYISSGVKKSKPSTIIKYEDEKFIIIRE